MRVAEVFDFGAGVANLAGLFTHCIDCFESIQLSRHFGQDYQKSILKLDIVANRLTRWGEAIGLCDSDFAVDVSAKEIQTAQNSLGEILNLFETLKEKSQKFAARAKPGDFVLPDTELDLDHLIGPLHEQFQSLTISRQQRSKTKHESIGIIQKDSWTAYEKNRFEVLLDDIRAHVDDLINVLPAKELLSLHNIAAVEVSEIKDPDAMELLMVVAAENDTILKEAVKRVIDARSGNVYEENITGDTARVRMGDEYGKGWNQGLQKSGNVYTGNRIADQATVLMGNSHGGKSVFDK